MKIVWVVRPAQGGIVQHLQQLLAGIPDFEFVLIAPSALAGLAGNRRFIPLDLQDDLQVLRDYSTVRKLRSILKAEKPQIVHAHGLKAVLLTAPALSFYRRQHFLYTAHNALPQAKTALGRVGYRLVKHWLFREVDRVISVSDALRSQLIKHVPARKVLTIRNGITLSRFVGHCPQASRQMQNLKAKDQVIGTVARLIDTKGLQTLLEAVSLVSKIVPCLQLVIVGDGPQRQKLEIYSARLGLKGRVHFLGWRDDVPQLMAGWDCFALPSFSEGFNLSVLEAMASELPVVVSDLPAFREAVVPGRSGYLITPGQAPELAAALLHVCKGGEKTKLMGKFNLERVTVLFAEEEMVKCTRALYEGLPKK